MADEELIHFLPDASVSKVINRKFLFNVRSLLTTDSLQVINTIKPQFFQLEIQKALIVRKNKQALTQNKFIEMNEQMLQLITNSNHVSTGKSCSHPTHPFSYTRQSPKSAEHSHLQAQQSRVYSRSLPDQHDGIIRQPRKCQLYWLIEPTADLAVTDDGHTAVEAQVRNGT